MGQTCQTCVNVDMEYIPKGNMFEQNVQNLINLLKCQLLQQPHQVLKSYQINQDTIFLGKINAENKKQGYGQLRYKGKLYAGNFVNNVPHGKGLIRQNDYLYYGEFQKGKPHGNGQQRKNDLQFIGQFENGNKVKGKLTHSEFVYQGQFKDNLFDGKGKINYFTYFITYQGQFKNGKFHGDGLITFKDKYKYQGQFQNGNYHGKGLMLSDCGQIFEGTFQNGLKNGQGWVKTTDGHQIFAKWRDCLRHGKGKVHADGDEIHVEWNDDKLVHNQKQ